MGAYGPNRTHIAAQGADPMTTTAELLAVSRAMEILVRAAKHHRGAVVIPLPDWSEAMRLMLEHAPKAPERSEA